MQASGHPQLMHTAELVGWRYTTFNTESLPFIQVNGHPQPMAAAELIGWQLFAQLGSSFSLSGPPHIQKRSSNQFLGAPTFEAQNSPLKPPSTYLGLKVHNLQILQIMDLPDMSTSSIMPFHSHASISIHRFSRAQQFWPRGLIFAE